MTSPASPASHRLDEPLPSGHRPHVMPWWLGPLLVNPLRRLTTDPKALLAPLVKLGDTALENGPGYGFFTRFLAEAVGQDGRVVCVDVQPQMLRGLERRLDRFRLRGRVETRQCSTSDLGVEDLDASVDLVVAVNVVHEMSRPAAALAQMAGTLRSGGRLLLVEPRGHCPTDVFRAELRWLEQAGLRRIEQPQRTQARGQAATFLRP